MGTPPRVLIKKEDKKMTKKTEVATYSRVTSAEQAQSGYSLESQREALRDYAAKNNLEIVREISDIGSGSKTDREGFIDMFKFLESSETCKTILITKPDRLCRDYETFKQIQQKYSLICICSPDEFMANQIGMLMAENSAKRQSEIMKHVWKKRKEKEVGMKETGTNQTSQWIEHWVEEKGSEEKSKTKETKTNNAGQWIEHWVDEKCNENKIEGESHDEI